MFRRVFLARLLLAALFGALLVPAQAQEKFSEPALSDPDSWTVVLLPDLQGYAKKACNQPIMEIMTTITSILMTTAIPMITCTHTPTATSTTFTPLLTACSLPIK